MRVARDVLDRHGLTQVGPTTGETTTWERFDEFTTLDDERMTYAQAILENEQALANLALITSHGFNQKYDPRGIELLRDAKPGLHAWTTSYTWGDMDVEIVEDARNLIYGVGCNGLIPWALVHNDYESDKLSPPATVRVSGNANSPFKTNDGELEVTKAYYFYKQLTRAGRGGMAVAAVSEPASDVGLIGFAKVGDTDRHAVVVVNRSEEPKLVGLEIRGAEAAQLRARITSDPGFGDHSYGEWTDYNVHDPGVTFEAPPRSVVTFWLD